MIPADVTASIVDIAAQVDAASPLETASRLAISALQQRGAVVLAGVDAAMAGAGAILDAGDPSGFPGDFPAALIDLAEASDDQAGLSDMRGLVGRALFNLAQA